MRRNHCSRSRLITGVSQRSHNRSSPTTCSRATVVLQLGQKSTAAWLRVGQVVGQQLDKEPLRPAVILGIGRGRLRAASPTSAPMERNWPRMRFDVGVGPLLGVDVALDRRVLPPAGRRSRTRSGTARCTPACAGSGRARPTASSHTSGRCAGRRTDRAAWSGSSAFCAPGSMRARCSPSLSQRCCHLGSMAAGS